MFNQKRSAVKPILVVLFGFVVILLAVFGFLYFFKYGPFASASSKPKAVTLTASGAGSALYAFQFWNQYYEKKYGKISVEQLPSSDTAIGILGLKEKTIDLAALSRLPKDKEKFPELAWTPLTRDAVVFAVNPSVTNVTNLTDKQLVGIYTGKITNWKELGGPDARIVVLDRNEQDAAKTQIREVFLKNAKIPNTAVELSSEKDLLEALLNTPNSIGFLSRGRAKTVNLTILSLNNISADAGVPDGTYPLARKYYIGYRTDGSPSVKAYINFIETEGRGLFEKFNYFPLSP